MRTIKRSAQDPPAARRGRGAASGGPAHGVLPGSPRARKHAPYRLDRPSGALPAGAWTPLPGSMALFYPVRGRMQQDSAGGRRALSRLIGSSCGNAALIPPVGAGLGLPLVELVGSNRQQAAMRCSYLRRGQFCGPWRSGLVWFDRLRRLDRTRRSDHLLGSC